MEKKLVAFIVLLPLVVLKGIGDCVIALGKVIFSPFLISLSGLKKMFFSGKKQRSIPKQKIIFKTTQRISFYNPTIAPIKLPKLNLSRWKKLKIKFQKIKPPKIEMPRFWFLKKTKRVSPLSIVVLKLRFFIAGCLLIAILFTGFQVNKTIQSIPNPEMLQTRAIPTTTKIYDRNGQLLYETYADENRTPVKLRDVPDIVQKATLATEDQDFYSHRGFSIRGIIRSIINNLQNDSVEGGSTITQQLVRSALLTPEKTIKRKVTELLLSIWTETVYSKDQILEMYLNQIPYGGTAWGIEAASETYFAKSVKNLNLSEASFLAGLSAAPSYYSPFGAHQELWKKRQETVLSRMVSSGYISEKEADDAKNLPLSFEENVTPIVAPHFVMYIRDLLEEAYGAKIAVQGGLRVTTTLDLTIQKTAENILANEIDSLKNLNVRNGAALITNPTNGQILAMVGSANYFDKENDGNVNLTTSFRQPGSSIKVVTYAEALSHGYTPATILDDSPITYQVPGQAGYSPVNYDGRFHGKVPLRVALGSSYNVPAVKTLATLGVLAMVERARNMGITTWQDSSRFGLSLTLGGGEVTMLDMAKVYGTLANNGKSLDLSPILSITNVRGEAVPLPPVKPSKQAVSPEVAFLLSNILSDNNARTPAFGLNSKLVISGKTVAVKTGTSDNKRDNWTIGFTPNTLVAVWVGNNDNSPMNPSLTSGVTGAAPIWNGIMTKLLEGKPDLSFEKPVGIISMPCYGRIEYFIIGTEPKGGCVTLPSATPTHQ